MDKEYYLNQLVTYVSDNLELGVSGTDIQNALLASGWSQEYVSEAFVRVSTILMGIDTMKNQNTGTLNETTIKSESSGDGSETMSARYRLRNAFKDFYTSFRFNPVMYFLSLLSTFVFIFVVSIVVILSLILIIPLLMIKNSGNDSLLVMIPLTSYMFMALLIGASSIQQFFLASTSVVIFESKAKNKIRFKEMLMFSLSKIFRLIKAGVVTWFVSAFPLLILFFTLILGKLTGVGGWKISLGSFLVLSLFGIIWLFVAAFRYILVPYVSMFEPDIPISKTLSRSRQLLRNGGGLFVLKLIISTLFTFIVIGVVTGISLDEMRNSRSIIINIIQIVLGCIYSGVLVMFYINRRQIKSL